MADPAAEAGAASGALDKLRASMTALGGASAAIAGVGAELESVATKALQAATGIQSFAAIPSTLQASVKALGGTDKVIGAVAGAMAGKVGAAGAAMRSELDAVAGKIRGLASAAGSGGEMSAVAGQIRGVMDAAKGAVSGGVDKLGEQLEKLGPAGQAAAAALRVSGAALGALIDIAAGAVGVMGALLDVTIAMSQKASMLQARFGALAGSALAGAMSLRMLSGLNLPFKGGEVRDWAQSLMAAGMSGRDLRESVLAVASAQALMGESGAAAATKMLQRLAEGGASASSLLKDIQGGSRKASMQLAEMGLNMADLGGKAAVAKMSADQLQDAITEALKKKGAGPLAEMALTFPVMIAKLKEQILGLFSGLGPEVTTFMKVVKQIFGELGGSVKSGKPAVTDLMRSILSFATSAAKAALSVVKFFKSDTGGSVLKGILIAIGVVAVGLIAILAYLAAPIAVIGAVLGVVVSVVGAVIGAFVALGVAVVSGLVAAYGAVTGFLSSLLGGSAEAGAGGQGIGAAIVDGIASAIAGGAGRAIGAVTGLIGSVIGAARGAADAHSPSRKMSKLVGGPLGQGVTVGMQAENDNAVAAGAGLANAAVGGAAKGAAGGIDSVAPAGAKGTSRGGDTYNVTVVAPPGADAKRGEEFGEAFVRKIRDLRAEAA